MNLTNRTNLRFWRAALLAVVAFTLLACGGGGGANNADNANDAVKSSELSSSSATSSASTSDLAEGAQNKSVIFSESSDQQPLAGLDGVQEAAVLESAVLEDPTDGTDPETETETETDSDSVSESSSDSPSAASIAFGNSVTIKPPLKRPTYNYVYELNGLTLQYKHVSSKVWKTGTMQNLGHGLSYHLRFSGSKIVNQITRFKAGYSSNFYLTVTKNNTGKYYCQISLPVGKIQGIVCVYFPTFIETYTRMQDGIQIFLPNSWTPTAPFGESRFKDGWDYTVQIKDKNGKFLKNLAFKAGTPSKGTIKEGKDTYFVQLKDVPNSQGLVQELTAWFVLGGETEPDPKPAFTTTYTGMFGGERNGEVTTFERIVNDELKKTLDEAPNNTKSYNLGPNIVELSIDNSRRVYLKVVTDDRAQTIIKNTHIADGTGIVLARGVETDTNFGAWIEGSEWAGLAGLSSIFYFQVAIVPPNFVGSQESLDKARFSFRFRAIIPGVAATFSCGKNTDGCIGGADALMRGELRLNYEYPKTEKREARSVYLAGGVGTGLADVTIPRTAGEQLAFMRKFSGVLKVKVKEKALHKKVLDKAANLIAKDEKRSSMKAWVLSEVIRKIGTAMPDMHASFAVKFTPTTAQAAESSKAAVADQDDVLLALQSNPDFNFPDKLPDWADSLIDAIEKSNQIIKYLDSDTFIGAIPDIDIANKGYKYSPKALLKQLTPSQKNEMIKYVLDKALVRTLEEGVPSLPGSATKFDRLLNQGVNESTPAYNARIIKIISENILLSLGSVFETKAFWEAMANGAFGVLTEQMQDYVKRVLSFMALGGTAAAAAATIAGGLGNVDVPGYIPPVNPWNIATSFASGLLIEYQIGNGAWSKTQPRELSKGTSLKVKFTFLPFNTKVEEFVVGTPEKEHDILPDASKYITVSSTATAGSTYTIRAKFGTIASKPPGSGGGGGGGGNKPPGTDGTCRQCPGEGTDG